MRKFLACTALLLSSYFACLTGQIKIPELKLFTVSDGLSQSNINVIIQDSFGFLWVGTEGGLNRYDGYEFVSYAHQPNDSNSLSNNFINAICEGNNGILWVATNNGLNSIDLKSGKIKSYFHSGKNQNSLSDNVILNVYIDSQNTLWVKTLKSLDKFDFEKGNFTRYSHYNDIFYYTSSNTAFPIIEDSKSRMWVGSKDGLNFFDRDLQLFNRYISLDFNPNSISDNEIRCMVKNNNGKLWIGTAKGLNEFDPEKKVFIRHFLDNNNNLYSGNNRINTLYYDKDSVLWIGTSGGLFYLKPNTILFSRPITDNNLINLPILSITSDRSGILWVGCNKGLIKLSTRKTKFQAFRSGDPELRIPSLDIGSIFDNNDKTLWIGTWGKGLNLFNRVTKKMITYNLSKSGEDRNNFIHCIYKLNRENILIGTENGVIIFNPISGSSRNLCQDVKSAGCEMIYQNRVNSILEDINKKIWIATSYGLFSYDRLSNSILGYFNNPDDNNSVCDNKINTLLQDKNHHIWIGTDNGLDQLDPITKTFVHLNHKKGDLLLSSNTIYSLKFDSKGFLWVGTATGLNRLDTKKNQVTMITEKQGLSDNLIYSIEVDNHDRVWVSTNRGINRIVPDSWVITCFDINDGLQDYEFNLNSSCKNNSGELIFGGISGFNVFNPDSLTRNDFIPPIVITSIEIITSKEKIFRQNLINGQITVPHRTKVLTINFASLDFTMPEKNNYAYKLFSVNEKEPEWIYLGKKHSATLTNLKPGDYIFKLKGSNSDEVWNENGISINIKVESPFWLKPQAIYIYIFIGIILLLGIYRYRTYSLRKTNKMLKEREIASYEIERQRELLEIKNKNITDSINYAKLIQEALMPSGKSIKRILPESFVFHQPKDIVSGDFFWVSERRNKIFVAAVDCTGHGVPGAFMSIIGFELFRKITHNQGIENPSQILSILNKEFEEIFSDVDNYVMRDGMDIAFCVIDKKNKLLEYSGAVNPIYLIRDDKITEISGSRFSVGVDSSPDADRGFDNKQILLQDDDVIYLFSDGYADQFGGPDDKKFKYRRFRHLLLTIHKYPMEEQNILLSERINRWKGESDQVDDILVIGFKPVFN